MSTKVENLCQNCEHAFSITPCNGGYSEARCRKDHKRCKGRFHDLIKITSCADHTYIKGCQIKVKNEYYDVGATIDVTYLYFDSFCICSKDGKHSLKYMKEYAGDTLTKLQGKGKFSQTNKRNETRLKEVCEDIINFDSSIVSRIQNQKSKLKNCPDCGSNIAVSFVKSIKCPCCSSKNFGYTKTDIKKIERLKEIKTDLNKRIIK